MTRPLSPRLAAAVASLLAGASAARAQDLSRTAAKLGEALKDRTASLAKSQELAKISRVARGAVEVAGLNCKEDSGSPFAELDKAKAALRAAYPDLPWNSIIALADHTAQHDLAIVLGTRCQDYVFDTTLKTLEAATYAGIACKGKAEIDLAACLQQLTCAEAGSNSQACGAKFSWE